MVGLYRAALVRALLRTFHLAVMVAQRKDVVWVIVQVTKLIIDTEMSRYDKLLNPKNCNQIQNFIFRV